MLISWENEAHLAKKELGKGEFEIVYPSISVLAEPPVAVVEKNATRRKTLELANEYLAFLYSPQAQEIIAQNFYRPYDKKVLEKHAEIFPAIKTVTIADLGGWKKAQKEHFDDEGSFDQIYGSN